MSGVRGPLVRLGEAGLVAPLVAVGLGMAVPGLSALARDLLVPAACLMLAMSVTLAEPGRLRLVELRPLLALAFANLLLTPVVVHLAGEALGWHGQLTWLLLVAACPAAGSAAMFAGMLGLPVRPLLIAQLICFAAMPLTLPVVAATLVQVHGLDAHELFWRALVMVALPALLGYGLRHALGERRRVAECGRLRGIGVAALCGIGLALGDLPARALAWPAIAVETMAGLLVVSAVGALLGWLCGTGTARPHMAALALGGAVRNVSLLWAAMQGLIPHAGDLALAMGTLWTLLLPALVAAARGLRPVLKPLPA